MNQKDKSGQFVNDLLRTEFHKCVRLLSDVSLPDCHLPRKFMAKFIKVCFTVLNVQYPACLFSSQ